MATREDLMKQEIIKKIDNGEINISKAESGVQYGNHTDQVFPFQVKLETDQKCVKPTISVYGGDIDKCIEQAWNAFDKVKKEGNDRGVPVAPLTSISND